MRLRTDLAKVRGLGSAKEGSAHWWAQRVTAVALVPLVFWFVASIISLVGAQQGAVQAWVAAPWVAILLILLCVALFHHLQLGLQVILEDYVHIEWLKIASVLFVKFVALVSAFASIFSILRVAFLG